MRLAVIIPAYNEESTITQVINEIPKNIDKIDDIKIIVINDGSADRTRDSALKAGADKVINNIANCGLAKTFQIGINEALSTGADIIVNTDADNQYNQKEINKLIQPILEKRADIVIGDRQVRTLNFMPRGNKYGNIFGSWVVGLVTGHQVIDASSGFRAFSREAALKINIYFKHTYTHETIIQAVNKNLAIANIPIEFRPRQGGKSKLINSLYSHIKKSLTTIVRSIIMYRPLKILFYLGSSIGLIGVLIGLRFVYFFLTNQGAGKIQSLILASTLILMGFIIIIFGFIGDLIANNRKLNEEILYQLKNQSNKQK